MEIHVERLIYFLFLAVLFGCQEPSDKAQAHVSEHQAQLLEGQCQSDEDCMVTGCHKNLCRSEPDLGFCRQTLVLKRLSDLKPNQIVQGLTVLLHQHLKTYEWSTIDIDVRDQKVVVTFHSDFERRAMIEKRLEVLDRGGIYQYLPNASALARTVYEQLGEEARQKIGLYEVPYGPTLLQTPILGGDELQARARLQALLQKVPLAQGRYVYQTLIQQDPPILLAWPIPAKPVFSYADLSLFRSKSKDNGFFVIQGQFNPKVSKAWQRFGQSHLKQIILWVAGDQVIFAPVIFQALPTKFEISLAIPPHLEARDYVQDLVQRVEDIRMSPTLGRALALDREATQAAEAYLQCYTQSLAQCRCIRHHCQWDPQDRLKACIHKEMQ